jgi:hypothetical protein
MTRLSENKAAALSGSLLLAAVLISTGWAQVTQAPKTPQRVREMVQPAGQKAAPSQPARPRAQQAGQAAQPAGRPPVRDPFKSLLVKEGDPTAGQQLPPGKAGLVIGSLTINGIVLSATDNIAVVTMPGRNRAYFLRARDELFNGYVEAVTADGVVFRERASDPFGRVFEKEVVKQVTTGAGAKR